MATQRCSEKQPNNFPGSCYRRTAGADKIALPLKALPSARRAKRREKEASCHKPFLVLLPLLLALILSLASFASAASPGSALSVEKLVNGGRASGEFSVGENLSVQIVVRNSLNQSLKFFVRDKTVISGRGFDVQCKEGLVGPGESVSIEYPPIPLTEPGSFTLPAAAVTYTDPRDSSQKQAESNQVSVSVKGAPKASPYSSVTSIYECNGVRMQSVSSSSSGSSVSISTGFGSSSISIASQISGMQRQMDELNKQFEQEFQKRLQAIRGSSKAYPNTMNENTQALKSQIASQHRKNEELKREFEKNLNSSPLFQRAVSMIKAKGMREKQRQLSPQQNDSGSFSLTFAGNNESSSISGAMSKGSVQKIRVNDKAFASQVLSALAKNGSFQELNRSIYAKGFRIESYETYLVGENKTLASLSYSPASGSEGPMAYINATITNGSVESLSYAIPETKANQGIPWLAILAGVALLALIFLIASRLKKHPLAGERELPKKKQDPWREILFLVSRARALYENGRERDAIVALAFAMRRYVLLAFSLGEEPTNEHASTVLRENGFRKLAEMLKTATLVEFAKVRPEKGFFKAFLEEAERMISRVRSQREHSKALQ